MTHYEVLGLAPSAGPDEIKRAWRRIARESHPDRRGGDASDVQRFQAASAAYEVLSDPGRRSTYDFGLRTVERYARSGWRVDPAPQRGPPGARYRRPPWDSRRMWDAPPPHPDAGRGHRRRAPSPEGPAAHDLGPDAQKRHDEAMAVLAPAVALFALGPFALVLGAGVPPAGLVAAVAAIVIWWRMDRNDPYRLAMSGLSLIVALGAGLQISGL